MEHVHKFYSFDPRMSDFDSKDGEIAIPTNLFQLTDGSFGPLPATATIASLPEEFTAMAIHRAGNRLNVIVRKQEASGETAIYWADMKSDITTSDMRRICAVEDIRCLAMSGTTIVVGTSDGLRYIVWDGGGYIGIDLAKAFPIIEFGLVRAGTLSRAETFVLNGETINSTDGGGISSGASRPHPSTETERIDSAATFKGIAQAYRDAVDEQVTSKGYFHQPFFIRYALRMADGSHILPSAPVLMLPTVLPPCLGLDTGTDPGGKSTVTTNFSQVKYFELVYRMAENPSPSINALITAIDIFVSPQIPTFDESRLDDGYFTTFSKVMKARNTVKDRVTRSDSRDEGMIFDGYYSSGNDDFTAHYLSDDVQGLKALMVHPNLNFHQQICAMGSFYKIASVPCHATDGFEKIKVTTVDFTSLEKCLALRDLPLSHYHLMATAILAHDDVLSVACEGMKLPQPFPVKATGCARSGSVNSVHMMDITVYTRIEGEVRRISTHCSNNTSMADSVPRYVFYPDRRAFMMTFSDGEKIYALPLTPHPKLWGAFWAGGMETDFLPVPVEENDLPDPGCKEPSSDTTNRLITSDPGNIYIFDSERSHTFAQSATVALCHATKAPNHGVFGRHNLYAFTGEGIWMLEYADGKVKSAHRISNQTCLNSHSVVETGQNVAFASGGKIYMADGSEIIVVSDSLDSLRPTLTDLPHAEELLAEAEMTTEMCTKEEFLSGCVLHYSEEIKAIVTSNPANDFSLIYSPERKSWSVGKVCITGKIPTPAGCLAAGTCRNTISTILRFEKTSGDTETFLTTRPIKLCPTLEPHSICKIEVLGYFRHGNVRLAVYATDNLRDWHLLGSSECDHLELYSRARYRMMKICVAARLSEGEYLYGVRISVDD